MSEHEAITSTNEAAEATVNTESTALTNESTSWHSDEYSNLISAKGFKSADDVLKSYANLESMLGNSVRIPGADASIEAKQDFYAKINNMEDVLIKGSEDFYTKLGRPENIDGYDVTNLIDQDLADAIPGLDNDLNNFKQVAFEAGLTNEQAQTLVNMRAKELVDHQAQLEAYKENSMKELHSMWGQDFENRLNAAKQVAKIYGEKYPEQMNDLINGPTGNNPAFLNMLAELGETFKEKGHSGMQTAEFGMTPEKATAKIAEKRGDRGFMQAYTDSMHPKHAQAVEEMKALYVLANS